MKPTKKLIASAAACAVLMMGAAAQAADSHTITVNATVAGTCKFTSAASTVSLNLDPTLSTTVNQVGAVQYRCTKGTAPSFVLASNSTSSATGGNLVNGADSIPYTFSSSGSAAGSGMAPGQEKTLSVTVTVNQADAANVAPNTYSDTIAITLTP